MTDVEARRFHLGLVVGKFAPLHLGHEWLIEEAARYCDRLLILSYTNPEFDHCGVTARERWLAERFPMHERHVLDDDAIARLCAGRGTETRKLPPNDANDDTHHAFLAWLLREVLQRRPDALYSSETYGTACAAALAADFGHEVASVIGDLERRRFPVSASRIRSDPAQYREWMSAAVRSVFVRRIGILGGESSGKSTLAEALAAHFDTLWIPEYGRELWEQQGGSLSEPDLLIVAREQILREERACRSAERVVFCDTTPLTTAGYGPWTFGRLDSELEKLATRPYDGIVICLPDIPFAQDGTRRGEDFRAQQHAWYLQQAAAMSCPVIEVGGSVAQRVAQVAKWMKNKGLI